MSDNPYAPTEAPLADPTEVTPEFYVVSRRKFSVLFLLTLGLYSIYWHYENWHRYREASKESLWPVARAIFAVFFVHKLFERAQAALDRAGTPTEWNRTLHATVLVICIIISSVADRLSAKEIGSPVTDLLGLALLVPLYLLYLRAQHYINLACGDVDGVGNSRFTVANYVWIALGVVLWSLAILGLFVIFTGNMNPG